jgi:ABC-type proline/glycine betaine transport system permease subunit
VPFNLLQLQGDLRYGVLFILAIIPIVVAFMGNQERRGWALAVLGNLILFLTLLLPALAGGQLIDNAETILGEGMTIRNPRLLPSTALAIGLVGGYIILFAGLRDFKRARVSGPLQFLAAWSGIIFIILLFLSGQMEIYSIMVEYSNNGDLLGQRLIEHITFVAVALLVGLVIGVSMGLWASRDERAAQPILYTAGIIQTIPSLALFGLLLVPLARFGDQPFLNVLGFFLISVVVAIFFMVIFVQFQAKVTARLRYLLLVLAAVAMGIPLVLFTIIFVSFIFRLTLLALTDATLNSNNNLILLLIALSIVLWTIVRRFTPSEKWMVYLRNASRVTLVLACLLILITLAQAAQVFLRGASISDLTIRDLGVSGIGTAPALIALTLYSLLPLVRNTYAGLNNVDPAIIDSGRGMGMTVNQIFFQIELPLAFPVIMAGVRNAGVALVGIGAIATVIGAGGLGDFIIQGIVNTSIDLILLGSIPAILLAAVLDGGLRAVESLLTSPGIRYTRN